MFLGFRPSPHTPSLPNLLLKTAFPKITIISFWNSAPKYPSENCIPKNLWIHHYLMIKQGTIKGIPHSYTFTVQAIFQQLVRIQSISLFCKSKQDRGRRVQKTGDQNFVNTLLKLYHIALMALLLPLNRYLPAGYIKNELLPRPFQVGTLSTKVHVSCFP